MFPTAQSSMVKLTSAYDALEQTQNVSITNLSSSGGTLILHHTPKLLHKFPCIWTWFAIAHPFFNVFEVFSSLHFKSFLEETFGILYLPYGPRHVGPLRAICYF